jgi:prepilin-type N-terminal cleavage/methylation domain-containing protein
VSVPALRISSPSTAGFTLIELMIVVAVLAFLAVVAIPAVIKAARSHNETASIGALRTITTAQALHRDNDPDQNGIHDYAPTLDQLAETDPEIAALFGPDPRDPDPGEAVSLGGSGVLHCCAQGYYFAMLGTQPPPAAAFRAVAIPLSPATGKRAFAADDTGLILAAVGHVPVSGDEIIDPGTGGGSACGAACNGPAPIPIPTQADLDARDEALLARSRALILSLNQIADGAGIPGAQTLLGDPAFQPAVLDGIDLAGDGVNADDVTQVNLLDLAHALTPPTAPPEPILMDDATASALFSSYQSDIAALMDLALYTPHPTATAADFTGDPLAYLASLIAIPLFGGAGVALLALAIVLTGVLRLLRAPFRVRAT